MAIPSNIAHMQAYSMAIFRSAVHPEFFDVEKRLHVGHNEYDFEGWLSRGGHVLRFEHEGACVVEVITPHPETLPECGHVTTMPCAGERDHEQEFGERLVLLTSMQTELLTPHLYADSLEEMKTFADESESCCIEWNEEGGQNNLSRSDVQRYRDQLHTQGYHLLGECGLVLRTQTIFEIKSD